MNNSKNTAQTATDVYTVLPTVPFLNEVVCSDWKTAVKQLPDHCIDLVVTDPPYGMNFQSNYRNKKHKKIEGDSDLAWVGSWVG
jgi:site-specific DNA-methyltransferase (adenine-specific)